MEDRPKSYGWFDGTEFTANQLSRIARKLGHPDAQQRSGASEGYENGWLAFPEDPRKALHSIIQRRHQGNDGQKP